MYRHGHGGGILSRQERKRKREKRDSDKGYMHIHTYMYMMNKKEGVFDGHGCTGRKEGRRDTTITDTIGGSTMGRGREEMHAIPHHAIPCNTTPCHATLYHTVSIRFEARQRNRKHPRSNRCTIGRCMHWMGEIQLRCIWSTKE
jgi:hypothetical protein